MAYKWRFFENARDYDDFALSTASIIFNRVTSKTNERVKNILDYLKKVLRYRKISWEKMYAQEESVVQSSADINPTDYHLRELITGGINKCNFQIYLDDIPSAIYGSMKGIPREKNSDEFQNIYLSCLLTFLDQISLTFDAEENLNNLSSAAAYSNAYDRVYKIEQTQEPLLYHLDDSYAPYILLLVRRARMLIREELSELLYEGTPTMSIANLMETSDDNGQFEES